MYLTIFKVGDEFMNCYSQGCGACSATIFQTRQDKGNNGNFERRQGYIFKII